MTLNEGSLRDSLVVPPSNSRLHLKLFSSLGRSSRRRHRKSAVTATQALSNSMTGPEAMSNGPPSIPLPAPPATSDFLGLGHLESQPQLSVLLAEEMEPRSNLDSIPNANHDVKAIRRSVSVGRVFDTLRGKPERLRNGFFHLHERTPSGHTSGDGGTHNNLDINPKLSSCASPKAVRMLGLLDAPIAISSSRNKAASQSLRHSISADHTISTSNPDDLDSRLLSQYSSRSDAENLPEISCPPSPSLSEIEFAFESSFESYSASVESFSGWMLSSPSVSSPSSATSSPMSSPPATPTTVQSVPEGAPVPQIISPEDRDTYRHSCLGLLESLKAIGELRRPQVMIDSQSPLAGEVHHWETRLRQWDQPIDEKVGMADP